MDTSKMAYEQISEKADELADSGKTDETIELLRQGLKKAETAQGKAYVFFFQAELAHYEEKDNAKAIELHQRALKEDPENLLFLKCTGIILAHLGRQEEAVGLLDRALAINPDDVASIRQKGVSLTELGRGAEAIEFYDKALTINPDDYQSLRNKGVSLGKLDRAEEAIEFFDQALAIKPDDYDSLSNKGVSLNQLDRAEEAIELFDQVLAMKPNDYHSLGNKGTTFSKLGREDEAIELFDEALAIKPDDYHSLRQKGASLSKLGRDDEAIELFDQALAIKPDDYDSLRNKGVSLSKLDRKDEAIELFDQALAIKPDDYHSLRNKGVSFSKLGREEEANELFDQALAIKSDDYHTLREKGASLSKLDQTEEALDCLERALRIEPDDANAWGWKSKTLEDCEDFIGALYAMKKSREFNKRKDFQDYIEYKISFLEKKIADLNRGVMDKAVEEEDDIFAKVIEAFREGDDKILKTIAENEEKLKAFTSEERSIPSENKVSFLSVLRKWNSYTPVLPSTKGDNRGGGYFLHILGKDGAEGRGIVIDPGFNFVENFYEEGFKAADIDAVLISHAHNDHTVDLEAIITLIKKINDNIKDETGEEGEKRIDLFLNLGTFQKYSGWLSLKDSETINEVTVLHAGKTYDLSDQYNGLVIHAVKAKHDEIISDQYCLGFILELEGCRIALTGDTGWKVDGSIARPYMEKDIDLMIAHLGSIKEIEFDYIKKNTPAEKQKCLYSNHLGILGMGAMLNCVKPKLAVISEFGEELRPLRKSIAEKFTTVLEKTRCLPGDVGLHVQIPDLSVYCIVHRDFVPFEEVKVFGGREESYVYYYKDSESAHEKEEIHERARKDAREMRKNPVSIFERIKLGPVT